MKGRTHPICDDYLAACDALVHAKKQGTPHDVLQQFDLPADRALRNVQNRTRLGKTALLRSHVKGAKSIQRRQSFHKLSEFLVQDKPSIN
jgi:hypothetical protein